MGVGMTFEDYVDLRLKPLGDPDRPTWLAFEQEVAEMFPMPLVTASHHLRSRG